MGVTDGRPVMDRQVWSFGFCFVERKQRTAPPQ